MCTWNIFIGHWCNWDDGRFIIEVIGRKCWPISKFTFPPPTWCPVQVATSNKLDSACHCRLRLANTPHPATRSIITLAPTFQVHINRDVESVFAILIADRPQPTPPAIQSVSHPSISSSTSSLELSSSSSSTSPSAHQPISKLVVVVDVAVMFVLIPLGWHSIPSRSLSVHSTNHHPCSSSLWSSSSSSSSSSL